MRDHHSGETLPAPCTCPQDWNGSNDVNKSSQISDSSTGFYGGTKRQSSITPTDSPAPQ